METLAAGAEEPSGSAGAFSQWDGQPVGQQCTESSKNNAVLKHSLMHQYKDEYGRGNMDWVWSQICAEGMNFSPRSLYLIKNITYDK